MNQEEGETAERLRRLEADETINAAFEKMAYKLISKAYYSPTGLSTPNKIYAGVRAINKAIALDLVRKWFSENVEKQNR